MHQCAESNDDSNKIAQNWLGAFFGVFMPIRACKATARSYKKHSCGFADTRGDSKRSGEPAPCPAKPWAQRTQRARTTKQLSCLMVGDKRRLPPHPARTTWGSYSNQAREGISGEQAVSLRHPCLIPTASRLLVGQIFQPQKRVLALIRFCDFWYSKRGFIHRFVADFAF